MTIFKKSIILILSIFIFTISCDKIDNPLKEKTNNCGDENSPFPIKKILVEDYTGHNCVNCPIAAEKTHELIENYCDHIIPVSVHADYFARPFEPNLPEDFRTEAGEEYADFFNVQAYPSGMVNRTIPTGGSQAVFSYTTWAAAVAEQLTSEIELNIIIDNDFEPVERNLKINITTEAYADISGELKLSLLLTEDSITAPQNSLSGIIEDYVQMHVLRAAINGTWGEQISASGMSKEEVFTKNFIFNIDTTFNVNHCKIIAFVYKETTKEIIQAESEPVIKYNQ